ncbi:MAG: hypothetical protein JZU60_04220 [Ilumatobacteraceae bacterium]|jgi:hypothetical protein|nr:hypothetical protein [Ilumatobacteraceae bacterium]
MNVLDKVKELAENAVDATLGAGHVVINAAEKLTGLDLNNDGKVGDDAAKVESETKESVKTGEVVEAEVAKPGDNTKVST